MANKILSGKRILMVIAPSQFRDEELFEPRKVFEDSGAEVLIAACQPGEAKGMLGASVKPDLLISQVRAEQFDAVVIAGGMGSPAYLWNDEQLHAVVQSAHASKRVVAAICLSGAVLAQAGLLRGRRATVYPTPQSLQALQEGGARYVEEPVITDELIVTANGPEAAGDFAAAVAAMLTTAVV